MTRTIIAGGRDLRPFMRESLHIEGIQREPTDAEIEATERFLSLDVIGVEDVVELVKVYQPDAVLRTKPGLNVRVGRYVAPMGGPLIRESLRAILDRSHGLDAHPHRVHVDYELLHPFTDGNGRSGRTLWAWLMLRRHGGFPLGFLHHFYYQTLEAAS